MTAPSATELALRVDGLQAGYGRKVVVHGISLELPAGSTSVLLGSNGAGKTTTLKALVGAVDVKGGEVELFGKRTFRGDPAANLERGLALVPEGGRIFADFTVHKNLQLGAFTVRDARAVGERLELVLATFPRLRERLAQRAGTLSGGERQMLAIGRALMASPKLLMLDEPSLGLAPLIVREIFEIVKTLRTTGVTILLVEQNARAALNVADHGYVLETGDLVLDGPAQQLAGDPRVIETYLGAQKVA
jgi:branched-chain amino acid transport system ATP-binding protein